MDALLDFGAEYANKLPTLSTMNLIFQPLWTRPRVRSFAYGGGNVLGLENEKRDLVVVLIHTTWGDPAQSNEIKQSMEKFIRQAQELARKMDVYHPYLYLNYAESFQDVMSSYGTESMDFMLKTSQKYDPIQLWQKRVPGGFKLQKNLTSEVPKDPPIVPIGQYPPGDPYNQYTPTDPYYQYAPTDPYSQYPRTDPYGQYPPIDPYGQYSPIAPGEQYFPTDPYGQPPLTNPYGQYPSTGPYVQYPPSSPYDQYPRTGPSSRRLRKSQICCILAHEIPVILAR